MLVSFQVREDATSLKQVAIESRIERSAGVHDKVLELVKAILR